MLSKKLKIDVGMLPQSQPLEERTARQAAGSARNGCARDAACQPTQGEPGGNVNPSASPGKPESGVTRVFILSKSGAPLMPCHPARARQLLAKGRARIHKLYPFTIRLVDRPDGSSQPVRIKFDPGSKATGIAIVREQGTTQHVLHLAELEHRGASIRKRMEQRSHYRRRRRSTNLRYRSPRFDNRCKPRSWLPPSLQSRVDNILSWLRRYARICPIASISTERVRFDMQQMENSEVAGLQYQQGTLQGYEIREYLLGKWGRKCAYCGAENVPLEVEHVRPKANGGSDRVSNLTLACRRCNQRKGSKRIEKFLARKPEVLAKILRQLKTPLRDAAAVNATRNALFFALCDFGPPVESSSGSRTKFNRCRLGIPKTHALDAACVGEVERVVGWNQPVFGIKATGRGSYCRTRVTKHGFPRGYLMRTKRVHGFQTGDMVRAVVRKGKKSGVHVGRVAVRARGSFNIAHNGETVQGIGWRCCHLLSRADGYQYSHQLGRGFLHALKDGVSAPRTR